MHTSTIMLKFRNIYGGTCATTSTAPFEALVILSVIICQSFFNFVYPSVDTIISYFNLNYVYNTHVSDIIKQCTY